MTRLSSLAARNISDESCLDRRALMAAVVRKFDGIEGIANKLRLSYDNGESNDKKDILKSILSALNALDAVGEADLEKDDYETIPALVDELVGELNSGAT